MRKKDCEWINNILEAEDRKVRPGTAAETSGVSRLSKKYYQMTRETLKQRVKKKYFVNKSCPDSQERVGSRTDIKFYPYNSNGRKTSLFDRSSVDTGESRRSPLKTKIESGTKTRCSTKYKKEHLSVVEPMSLLIPYGDSGRINVNSELGRIREIRDFYTSSSVGNRSKNNSVIKQRKSSKKYGDG